MYTHMTIIGLISFANCQGKVELWTHHFPACVEAKLAWDVEGLVNHHSLEDLTALSNLKCQNFLRVKNYILSTNTIENVENWNIF